MILVKSKTDGFRRCGVAHSTTGKQFADDDFTEEQLEILGSDPELLVKHLPDQPGPDDDEEAKARKILKKMTNDKLKKECGAIGVEYPEDATKAVLIDLLIENTAPEPKE